MSKEEAREADAFYERIKDRLNLMSLVLYAALTRSR